MEIQYEVKYKFHPKCLQKVFRESLWCLGWFSLKSTEVLHPPYRPCTVVGVELHRGYGFQVEFPLSLICLKFLSSNCSAKGFVFHIGYQGFSDRFKTQQCQLLTLRKLWNNVWNCWLQHLKQCWYNLYWSCFWFHPKMRIIYQYATFDYAMICIFQHFKSLYNFSTLNIFIWFVLFAMKSCHKIK